MDLQIRESQHISSRINKNNLNLGIFRNNFIYQLFLVVLDLCCFEGFFPVAASRGYSLQGSHCGGSSCWGAQAVGHAGFSTCSMQARELWCMGVVAPRHVEPSWTRDCICVSCIGRWSLICCTTRDVLHHLLITGCIVMSRPIGFGVLFCMTLIFYTRLQLFPR